MSVECKEIMLYVEGMSCEHCKGAVEKAVAGLSGVVSAQVDLAKGALTVKYEEGRVAMEDIRQAVDDAGFGVR